MKQRQHSKPLILRVVSVVVFAINLLAAIGLVASAYGGRINPLSNAWGGIAAMTFPIWAVGVGLLLLINICWFRRSAIIDAVALAVCWGPLMDICPLNFNRPSMAEIEGMGSRAIKVMTYNVYNFNDIVPQSAGHGNRMVAFILEQDADLVMLQEGLVSVKQPHRLSKDETEALHARYPYIVSDGTGLNLLSKYPVECVRTEIDNSPSFAAARYDVEIAGQTVHLFNIHLQSIGLTPEDKALYRRLTAGKAEHEVKKIKQDLIGKLKSAMRHRAVQGAEVRAEIEKAGPGPVILGGDFNDVPGCFAMREIMGDNLREAYRAAGLGPAITYHVNRFYFRIDHLLYGGGISPLRVWRGDIDASDHYPLIGYFELNPAQSEADSISNIENKTQSNITDNVKAISNPGRSSIAASGLNASQRHGS